MPQSRLALPRRAFLHERTAPKTLPEQMEPERERGLVALWLVAVGQAAAAGTAADRRGGREARHRPGTDPWWPGRVGGLSGAPTRLATAAPRWLALALKGWGRCGL